MTPRSEGTASGSAWSGSPEELQLPLPSLSLSALPESGDAVRLTTMLTQVEDPELFMTLLRVLSASTPLSDIPHEVKMAIRRHALRIDPFQSYMRDLKGARGSDDVVGLLRENGPLLFAGMIENHEVELRLIGAEQLPTIEGIVNGVALSTQFAEQLTDGGIRFQERRHVGAVEAPPRSIDIYPSNHFGLVLELAWPGWDPVRMNGWREWFLPEEAPSSILPEVGELIGI